MRTSFAFHTLAPALGLVALALVASGCPSTTGALCPAGTLQAGVFNASLTFNGADPRQCFYSIDGGPLNNSLASTGADAGPSMFTAAICSGFIDGGPVIYFAPSSSSLIRYNALGDGGTFIFENNSVVTGTACGCDIAVDETISGALISASQADASVQFDADGGLPSLAGFTGSVVDRVSDNVADAGCSCNVPCDLQYTLGGTSF